jgi:hypothetical protein
MDYVSVYNGEDPLALLGIVVLFCPAFLLVGIALLILGRLFHVSTLNKWLPFIAIPGLSLPTWGGCRFGRWLVGWCFNSCCVMCVCHSNNSEKFDFAKRGEASNVIGSLRGTKSLLIKNLPLPLDKGKGIQGIGLINNYA